MKTLKFFNVLMLLLLCSSFFSCNAEQKGKEEIKALLKNKDIPLDIKTALGLPENQQATYYYTTTESDPFTKLIIRMSKKKFIEWISTNQLKLSDFEKDNQYLMGQNTGKWNPASLDTLKAVQIGFQNGMFLNIGYTEDIKDQVLIYLVFHGT